MYIEVAIAKTWRFKSDFFVENFQLQLLLCQVFDLSNFAVVFQKRKQRRRKKTDKKQSQTFFPFLFIFEIFYRCAKLRSKQFAGNGESPNRNLAIRDLQIPPNYRGQKTSTESFFCGLRLKTEGLFFVIYLSEATTQTNVRLFCSQARAQRTKNYETELKKVKIVFIALKYTSVFVVFVPVFKKITK